MPERDLRRRARGIWLAAVAADELDHLLVKVAVGDDACDSGALGRPETFDIFVGTKREDGCVLFRRREGGDDRPIHPRGNVDDAKQRGWGGFTQLGDECRGRRYDANGVAKTAQRVADTHAEEEVPVEEYNLPHYGGGCDDGFSDAGVRRYKQFHSSFRVATLTKC